MRLTCPNCTAQYQVPADAIPENGRDVQCSACNHTWFQAGATVDTAGTLAPPIVAPTVTAPAVSNGASATDHAISREKSNTTAPLETMSDDMAFEQNVSDTLNQSDRAQQSATQNADDPMPSSQLQQPDDAQDAGDDDMAIKPKLPKRELDPQVANVLREEAEREKRARLAAQAQEDAPLQSGKDAEEQVTDIGSPPPIEHDESELDDIAISSEPKRKKIYPPNLDDLDDLYNQTADTADQAKGNTLPDPDELKSSLQDNGDDVTILGVADPAAETKEKSNRRSGFILAFIVLAAGFWLYSNAAAVAQAIPQTKTVLQIFVLSVDAVRDGLNKFVALIVTTVSGWLA